MVLESVPGALGKSRRIPGAWELEARLGKIYQERVLVENKRMNESISQSMIWYHTVWHGVAWHGIVICGTVGHIREVSYSKGTESRTMTSLHVGSIGEEIKAEAPSHPSFLSSLKPQKPWRSSHTSAPGLTVPTHAGPGPAQISTGRKQDSLSRG